MSGQFGCYLNLKSINGRHYTVPQEEKVETIREEKPAMPDTYLWQSILVTIFCCVPFGIVGIVNASKVTSLYAIGEYAAAQKASDDAKKWTKIAFIVMLAIVGVYFVSLLSMVVIGLAKS